MSILDIEQNDVDISKLFEYKKEIVLKTPSGDEITLYQRVVGDEYNNRGRVHGLRESAKLRENLRNVRWEDRKAYIPATAKFKKEELVDSIINLIIGEITITAINTTQVPFPKKLDGESSLEDQEKYQKKIDQYRTDFNVAVSEKVTKEIEKRKIEFNKLTKEKLLDLFEFSLINDYTQKRSLDSYYEFVTYYGTFIDKDHTRRVTKEFDEFKNLPRTLKENLIASYKELELNSSDLKK